ncbi:MAG: dipeptidase PepE [Prevotellaceae bacterium]|jgi:dipeptidase E|nr:dipeptidase PepE [Prevotellaceae bacterium]
MRLLLLSNSTNAGESYLSYPKKDIQMFLEKDGVKEVLFVPYAAVTFSYDAYVDKVQERFGEFDVKVRGIHSENDPVKAVETAEAIVVGGGNTFHLLKHIQESGIIDAVRKKVKNGTPYIGWSAGSNVACPTICTTNDMPILMPKSFDAFNLIPFQINPHYIDVNPQGFAGESRDDRIKEYITVNPEMYVAGLREGCMFLLENGKLSLTGSKPVKIFKYGQPARDVFQNEKLDFLFPAKNQFSELIDN